MEYKTQYETKWIITNENLNSPCLQPDDEDVISDKNLKKILYISINNENMLHLKRFTY